jgi:hypothetical protein
MSDLDEVLAQVRQRIVRYRGQNLGEQNTKSNLIDPVLRALGWDTEDFEEVYREYRPKPADNPVDYALFILRSPRLFIEAKTLGGNLHDRRWANQIMGYAAVSGVTWVVLTDGDEYRLYNAHAPVPIEGKLFRVVRVSSDGPYAAETLDLLSKARMQENLIASLWKSAFVDNQIRVLLEALFGPSPDRAFVRLVRSRLPHLAPAEIRDSLGRLRVTVDVPAVPSVPSGANEEQAIGTVPSPIERGSERGHGTPWRTVTLQDLITAGLVTPPLDLNKTYKGCLFTARIAADGKVLWNGKEYSSLSTAAAFARASIVGIPPGRKYPHTNGWVFWEFVDAEGQSRPLDVLRQRYFHERTADSS